MFLFLIFLIPAFARLDAPLPQQYISGKELCERSQTQNEDRGFFVDVPIDYQDLSKGLTPIYGFFPFAPFDPQKPSLIYFSGGPGYSGHHLSLEDHPGSLFSEYNVLLFDQRGTGCSRPATSELYKSFDFYSSVATARDAEALRQHLNISKWSVVGRSYGAVPAFISASLFQTKSVSLTLFAALMDKNKQHQTIEKYDEWLLQHSEVQKAFNAATYLPGYDEIQIEEFKENIFQRFYDHIKTHGTIGLEVFSQKMIEQIQYAIAPQILRSQITHIEDLFSKSDPNVFYILKSKENLLGDMQPFGMKQSLYEHYPVEIPTTFFQGLHDPRTPASRVLRYLKNHRQVQVYLFDEAGHMVVNPQVEGQSNLFTAPSWVLEQALRGEISKYPCQKFLEKGTKRLLLSRP